LKLSGKDEVIVVANAVALQVYEMEGMRAIYFLYLVFQPQRIQVGTLGAGCGSETLMKNTQMPNMPLRQWHLCLHGHTTCPEGRKHFRGSN